MGDDLVWRIASSAEFSMRDLANLRQTNRQWRKIASSGGLPGNAGRMWDWWQRAALRPESVSHRDMEVAWLGACTNLDAEVDVNTDNDALRSVYRAAGNRWPLANLRSFSFSSQDGCGGAPLALLQLSPHLRRLRILGPLSDRGAKAIFKLSPLEELTLIHVDFRARRASDLGNLGRLTHLTLMLGDCRAVPVVGIAKLPKLTELTIFRRAALTPDELAIIASMPSLAALTLGYQEVDAPALLQFLPGAQLTRLSLEGCFGLSEEEHAALTAALAPARVVYER